MRPPFGDHPLIRDFNEIKRYFRLHETHISRQRLRDFRRFAHLLQQAGYDVAFDFVGSINFGVAEHTSDVDFVLYIRCENDSHAECDPLHCKTLPAIEKLILQTLMREYVKEPYSTHVVDCLNLGQLEQELRNPTPDSSVLFRFAFYRSICRGIHLRVLLPFHRQILENQDLLDRMRPELDAVFEGLNQSQQHHMSFEKYRSRLGSRGVQIPPSLIAKIQNHLSFRDWQAAGGKESQGPGTSEKRHDDAREEDGDTDEEEGGNRSMSASQNPS